MIGDMATKGYTPNRANITAILETYPGIAGSVIQTILKREGIEGDAYREIEKISINPDGTYANYMQFSEGLDEVMTRMNLSEDVAAELRYYVNPRNNYGNADVLAQECKSTLKNCFGSYLEELSRYRQPLI